MRRLAIGLVALLLAAACTSDDPSPERADASPSAVPSENPLGACARLTKIGLVPSADSVEQAIGAQTAIDLLNERESFSYELVEPEGTPQEAVRGFIANEEVSAVMGSIRRTEAVFLDDAGVPTVALSEKDVIETVGPGVVRIASTDIETVAEATSGLMSLLDVKKVGLLASKGVAVGFAGRAFERLAIATADAQKIAASNPELVAIVAAPEQAQAAIDDLARSGYEGPVVLGPASSEADPSTLSGDLYLATPWDPESPLKLSEDYVAEFESARGRRPELQTAYGYNAVILIARAVEETCSNDRADLVAEIPKARHATTLFGRFSFTRNGAPRHPVMVFELRGDQKRPIGLTPGPG